MDASEKIDALARLLDSSGWRVLTEELHVRYTRHSKTLRSVSDTADIGAVRRVQGALDELERFSQMPEALIRELRAELKGRQ